VRYFNNFKAKLQLQLHLFILNFIVCNLVNKKFQKGFIFVKHQDFLFRFVYFKK